VQEKREREERKRRAFASLDEDDAPPAQKRRTAPALRPGARAPPSSREAQSKPLDQQKRMIMMRFSQANKNSSETECLPLLAF
jgi:hypothetical protein